MCNARIPISAQKHCLPPANQSSISSNEDATPTSCQVDQLQEIVPMNARGLFPGDGALIDTKAFNVKQEAPSLAGFDKLERYWIRKIKGAPRDRREMVCVL